MIRDNKISEVWNLVKESCKYNIKYHRAFFSELLNQKDIEVFFCFLLIYSRKVCDEELKCIMGAYQRLYVLDLIEGIKENIIGVLISVTYEMAIHLSDYEEFQFNIGISVKHPAFQEISAIIDSF